MQPRLRWTWLVSLLLIPFAADANPAPAGEKPRRPNIVFILADDLGVHDLACYGRKEHRTPHLDRLAAQGMRFTAAYAAQSVCSPTRAAILTGQTPARLHLTTFLPGRPDAPSQLLRHPIIAQRLPAGIPTIARMLLAQGYVSALIGKWHLGGKGSLPTDHGFDRYHPGTAKTEPSATEGGKGEYDLTRQAEKFVEDNRKKPFFLCLCHHNPHVVLNARKELIEKNAGTFNPIYAAMIETLDDTVGRLVQRIDDLGLGEDTLILFTSDNGGLHVLESPHTPATHNGPFRAGKGFLYEGGIRIPLLARWTGKIRPGQVVDVPVVSTDWTPTLLAAAGVKSKLAFDGIDLLDLLLTGKRPPPRDLFWHQPHYTNQGGRPAGAIRAGDWKLIEHYEDGRCELFDLAADPGESKDLGSREPKRVAELRGKLEQWRRSIKAQENVANPEFDGTLARHCYAETDISRLQPGKTAATMAPALEPWRQWMNEVVPRKKTPAKWPGGAGAVLLHARDARVIGEKLRYEPQPHKDTLGFWVRREDRVEWTFDLPHAGTFEVEVLQACGKGSGGAEVEFALLGQKLVLKVEETGHFQRFIPRTLGTVRADKAGRTTLTVRALTKPGPAVMDLRRVVLRAAPGE